MIEKQKKSPTFLRFLAHQDAAGEIYDKSIQKMPKHRSQR